MRPFVLCAIALAAVLLGCQAASPDLEKERQAILAQDEAWASAAAAKDLEKTLAYWSEDATLMAPDMPVLQGKGAIREYVAAGFKAPGFGVTWKAVDVVVAPGGTIAYEVATNQFTMADSTGAIHTTAGKGVAVWRKGPDGFWRCVVEAWNANEPRPKG